MISKALFKVVSVCSLIIGAIVAVPTFFPFIRGFSFFALMFCVAPFLIVYLKRLEVIKAPDMDKLLTIGALSGVFSFIGFSVVFFPTTFLLNLIFKIQSFLWVKVVFSNFAFLLLIIILMAIVSALTNAFSSFLTAYFYQNFENRK